MTFYKAIIVSFEWRIVALGITMFILSLNGLPLIQLGWITLQLQLSLFIGQALWIYFRER